MSCSINTIGSIPKEFSSQFLRYATELWVKNSPDIYPEYGENLSSITLDENFSKKLQEFFSKAFGIHISIGDSRKPAPSFAYCGDTITHKDTKDGEILPILVVNVGNSSGSLNIHSPTHDIIQSVTLDTGTILAFNAGNLHSVTNAKDRLVILRCIIER